MTRLSDISTGDLITSSRQNDINDYISDGTEYVNTSALQIGSTEVFSSSRDLKNMATQILPTAASDPGSGTEGMIYYNTTDDELKSYDGAAWNACGGTAYTVTAKTANYSLTASDCDGFQTFCNDGSSGTITLTLPTAVAGYRIIVTNAESQTLQIAPGAGDNVTTSSVSASATGIKTTGKGDSTTLIAINATEWIAQETTGTWTAI